MKTIKPDYYDKFTCIASACDFTCCQDWNIAVDDLTQENWKKLKAPEEMTRQSAFLADYTKSQSDSNAIKLDEKGKCPFLNEEGLCRLVLKYGEECLSKTCHTFPRERHEFSNRIEYALSLGCKSVLTLLWEKEEFKLIETEEKKEAVEQDILDTPDYQFTIRDWFMEIASDKTIPVEKVLKIIFYLALDFNEKSEKEEVTRERVLSYVHSDIVEQLKLTMEKLEKTPIDTFIEDNELLLDIADNYRKKKIYAKYIEPVAQRAEQYEENVARISIDKKLDGFSKVWSQFESKMRLLLCEELYASCLLPQSDVYDMVMKLEWLAIEYAVIRQWLFLRWDEQGILSHEDLLEAVSVIFRMTGYSDEDIEEYLENSFEAVIWDWGYMDFII